MAIMYLSSLISLFKIINLQLAISGSGYLLDEPLCAFLISPLSRFTVFNKRTIMHIPVRLMYLIQRMIRTNVVSLVSLNLAILSLITPRVAAAPQQNGVGSASATQETLLAQGIRTRRMIFHLSDRGVPVSRIGGAARGICSKDADSAGSKIGNSSLSLIPLIPLAATGETVLETISSHPTFFVYLPKTLAEQVEISVRDHQSAQPLYNETLVLKRTGGIVQVSLPTEKVESLETNHQYSWQLTVVCDPDADDQSGNQVIKGEIKRVEAASGFSQIIKGAKLVDQAPLYAAEGYWLESLDTLAKMRQSNPQDPEVFQDWTDLLSSVKLDAIAQEPILINWAEKSPAKP